MIFILGVAIYFIMGGLNNILYDNRNSLFFQKLKLKSAMVRRNILKKYNVETTMILDASQVVIKTYQPFWTENLFNKDNLSIKFNYIIYKNIRINIIDFEIFYINKNKHHINYNNYNNMWNIIPHSKREIMLFHVDVIYKHKLDYEYYINNTIIYEGIITVISYNYDENILLFMLINKKKNILFPRELINYINDNFI